MRRKSKNLLASLTMFALLFSLFQPTFAVGAEGTLATPLVEKENVEITSGPVQGNINHCSACRTEQATTRTGISMCT